MQRYKSNFKSTFHHRLIRFSVRIIRLPERVQAPLSGRIISQQLIRSATSIGANVVEASAASSKREYIHYFQIALRSANETKYWLVVLQESSPGFREEIAECLAEAVEIGNILGSSILTMKGKKNSY